MSSQNSPQQILIGVALAAVGAIFLLDNLHIFDVRAILPFWPVVLIVVGVLKLSQTQSPGSNSSGRLLGAGMVLVGSLLTLRHLGIFDFRWREWWPLLLIAAGVMVIIKGKGLSRARPEEQARGLLESTAADSRKGEALNLLVVLSGNQSKVDTQDFVGGEITVVMGGAELDLRRALMQGDSAALQVFVMMGGLQIRLPSDWSVSLNATPLLGSIDDKTVPPLQVGKRLMVNGYAIFGGVEISN